MSSRKSIFLKSYIKMRFSEIDESLHEAENHFKQQAREVLPYTEEDLNNMSQSERSEVIEWYLDDYLKYTANLPIVLRNSYLISYYSLYEYFLNDVCIYAKTYKNLPSDIKDVGIWKSKKYLLDQGVIDLTKTAGWEDIENINKIRNAFVHNLGILESAEDYKEYFQKSNDLIELDHRNRIKIKDKYLEYVSKLFQNSLEEIINKIFT